MEDSDRVVMNLKMRGHSYQISCSKNEQQNVLELSAKFENLVNTISDATNGKGSDALIFLIAGLKLEDSIREMEDKLQKLTDEIQKYRSDKSESKMSDLCDYVVNRVDKMIGDVVTSTTGNGESVNG